MAAKKSLTLQVSYEIPVKRRISHQRHVPTQPVSMICDLEAGKLFSSSAQLTLNGVRLLVICKGTIPKELGKLVAVQLLSHVILLGGAFETIRKKKSA